MFKGGANSKNWTDGLDVDTPPDTILAHVKSVMQPVVDYDNFFTCIEKGLLARQNINVFAALFGDDIFNVTVELDSIKHELLILTELAQTISEYHTMTGIDNLRTHSVNLKRYCVKFNKSFLSPYAVHMNPIIQTMFDKALKGQAVL